MKCGEERGLPSPFPFLQNFQLHPTESQPSSHSPHPAPSFLASYAGYCTASTAAAKLFPLATGRRTEDVAGCESRSLFSNLAPQPLPKEYCTYHSPYRSWRNSHLSLSRFLLRPRPLFPRTVRPYAPLSLRISLASLLFLGAEAKVDHPRLIGRENKQGRRGKKESKRGYTTIYSTFFS